MAISASQQSWSFGLSELGVFSVQGIHPNKNDWTILGKQNLCDFKMKVDLSPIKRKSECSFRNLDYEKAHHYEFNHFLEMKQTHSKMDDLH